MHLNILTAVFAHCITQQLDYEVKLAIVIGKEGEKIKVRRDMCIPIYILYDLFTLGRRCYVIYWWLHCFS